MGLMVVKRTSAGNWVGMGQVVVGLLRRNACIGHKGRRDGWNWSLDLSV